VCRKIRVQGQTQGLGDKTHPSHKNLRLLRLGGVRRGQRVRAEVSVPRDSHTSVLFTPDTGEGTTAIGPRHLRELNLSDSDLSPPQDGEVLMANSSTLSPLGSFQATLSLGNASTVSNIDVFREVHYGLLSWYDAPELRIVTDNYSTQISSVKAVQQLTVRKSDLIAGRVQQDCQRLLSEFQDILVDPEVFHQ